MRASNGVKKYILIFSILISAVIFSVALINRAVAQDGDVSDDALSKLTYPIIELGNCKDQADCKIYCDDSANAVACVSYAEKNNLLSQEELQIAKKFVATGGKGPGSCNGKKECQAYCEDKNNIDECVSYAEKNGLMSEQDLQKAKKVQTAIKNGVKFPSCQNKKECDAYCEDTNHMEECMTFAKEAGLLSEKELENTQKVLTAVKKGVKLPSCKGKEACDAYCGQESNADECVNFAIAAGIVTSEEAKLIKETGGKGPGGCKNKKECDSYCSISDNKESCLSFAKEHNLISQEQLDRIKQDGTGPGNGADQGKGGPGEGAGPGNGAGQGGGNGGPNQGDGFNPGSNQNQSSNSNPTKCAEDCELVGKNCMSQASEKSNACLSKGTNCRTVTCETFGSGGTRPTTKEEWDRCASYCRTIEDNCYAAISPTDGECRTTKDTCVTSCKKSSKPTKPTQPAQSGQPVSSNRPSQPSQPTSSMKPAQPTAPTQPAPAGKCGDGICGKMEKADSTLCPQDCGG